MTSDTVHASSPINCDAQPRTSSSAAPARESFGQVLNDVLAITDEADRKNLIDHCIDQMNKAARSQRRSWMRIIEGLIEGRPQAERDRLEAERMARVVP